VATPGKLLHFAVPPSLGPRRATLAASSLELFLSEALAPSFRAQVVTAKSYQDLADKVVSGQVEAGWAPPLVCARVERSGGRAVVRLVRGGVSTYRSAFVCRSDKPVRIAAMKDLVVSWVDRESTSGHLLPIAWLKQKNVDIAKAFRTQRFAGSFQAAVNEVAAGVADLTATFASAEKSKRPYLGIDDLPKPTRELLEVIAYTNELPNDAVVVGAGVAPSTWEYLSWKLLSTARADSGKKMLKDVFGADGLEAAPERSYGALYNLITN
jgi:phosphonate transport system substrate-binding protein